MAALLTDDFQVFIKPVGARCNLRCSYCYYIDKTNRYGSDMEPVMSDETLENCIRQLFAVSTGNTVLFTWHGGEPLLAGIDFYKKALSIQKRYLPQGKSVLNAMQTNGTLLTKTWCEFLAANGFMVGISIDGQETFHDAKRRSSTQQGSFEKTRSGYQLLLEYDIHAEILCVVNACNVEHPLAVYDFFKMLGAQYVTFLPFVEKSNAGTATVSPASVPALAFGHFLASIFDEWIKQDIGKVKIQIIEEALRTAFHQDHSLCIFRTRCGGVPVIEQNGDFYPCDHYVRKDRLIGNIHKNRLDDLLNHPAQKAFGNAKADTLPQYCLKCEALEMCHGECPKNRFILSPDGEPGLNYLCEGYRYFFNHCKPFIDTVAAIW